MNNFDFLDGAQDKDVSGQGFKIRDNFGQFKTVGNYDSDFIE